MKTPDGTECEKFECGPTSMFEQYCIKCGGLDKNHEPPPADFDIPMAPGPHPLRGPILFFGGIVLALITVVFLLSCATPSKFKDENALRRSIGDGLVFCLSHEPARSNPGFRDQCHINAEFECLDHKLPKQCAEDTTLTSLPGGR